ncbi:DUF397 domain-containing protein [Streptomyces albidoflavus]|uniref:DUF397 domain-containing protein n=1 Tax=Streptomyces albidoflavus TaxID=1886 RepID=UPI001C4392EE|nr:DUF397 domain-containing protein [Streptomyces albidoflavus]MBV7650137.1 DUF397 domain-containing protein [Streptomyces albidoflavus]MBV7711603.1 DUF397 domain-containing protein [Streptomyces albidoflavus]MCU7704776.1 DUF397 domain-containing protein [Streptomyces albidoflavus]
MTTEPLAWFKSSYSADGGQCVEVAADLIASHGVVPVRDSKIQSGPILALPASSFSAFVAEVKVGGFSA